MAKPPEERARRFEAIPDPARREKWRELLDHGIDSPVVGDAMIRFARLLRDMERALHPGPWLTGDSFSLADIGLISFFYRLEVLRADNLWSAHFPAVDGWIARCKSRPSFAEAVGQYITPARQAHYAELAQPLRPQIEPRFREALKAI